MWLQGLICGALLAFAPAMALLLGVLLAPAIACFAADMEHGRGATRSVALACILQSLWSVREILRANKIEAEIKQIREEWHLEE
jgi:hypothetical protein